MAPALDMLVPLAPILLWLVLWIQDRQQARSQTLL